MCHSESSQRLLVKVTRDRLALHEIKRVTDSQKAWFGTFSCCFAVDFFIYHQSASVASSIVADTVCAIVFVRV